MSTHLLVGTAAHAGLEAAYRSAATFPGYLPGSMSRYRDEALDAVTAKWEALGIQTADEAALPQVHDYVANTLDALPVPHPQAVLGVELDLTATAPWGTPVQVAVDLALRTGKDSVHVRDWKYRRLQSLPTDAELLDDLQLGVYCALVRQMWPWVRTVTAGLFSVVSAREVAVEFPPAAAAEALERLESTAEKAESDHVWEPRPSPGVCGSCRFVSICPQWTNKAP